MGEQLHQPVVVAVVTVPKLSGRLGKTSSTHNVIYYVHDLSDDESCSL